MDFTRTLHPIAALTLALLLPACVIDTKLIDNDPSTTGADPGTSAATDDGATSVTDGDGTSTTTDPTTSTDGDSTSSTTDMTATQADDTAATADPTDTADTADACSPLDNLFEWFIVTDVDGIQSEPIDETCTVVTSVLVGEQGVELHLDCPQHAVMHGEFEVALLSGPIPVLVPQPGDELEVYFQPWVDDDINTPRPQLLFLRSGGELLYASAFGFYIDPNDAAIAAARQAPLTADIEPGPCPLADNPSASDDPGDGFICKREAHALLRVSSPDDDDLLLAEFTKDQISVGPRSYTTDVLLARHGEDCVDLDLEKFAYAIALTTAP